MRTISMIWILKEIGTSRYVYVIWMWIDWYRKYQPAEPEYEAWWRVSETNESQTSYSVEQADIFQYQLYKPVKMNGIFANYLWTMFWGSVFWIFWIMWFFPRKYKYRCIRVYVRFKDDKHVIWMWIWLILKNISMAFFKKNEDHLKISKIS
jgi:hypothetical protein